MLESLALLKVVRRRAIDPLHHLMQPLSPDDERELGEQIDRSIVRLLPVLGPAFGASIILFGGWDYWIDAAQAGITAKIRLVLVMFGAMAYWERLTHWSPLQRCIFIYATHTGAMIVSSALLAQGIVLGLAGLTASMMPVALFEPRLRRLFAIILLPSCLYFLLGAATMPVQTFISSSLLYMLSIGLSATVAVVNGRLRRDAFLFEKALLHASRYDSLSGALSRAYVTELAQRDVALAQRHHRPFSAAMLDIDHFKKVNDNYGHGIGDAVIRELAKTCSHCLRASDYFGRVGGEEFVCVMPETQAGEALACAERMRIAIDAIRLPTERGTVQFTISAGVAELGERHAGWEALLIDADGALYQAKASGRNRVVLAESARRNAPVSAST
jgi:diguanylate cyclase (GGDEF)-like protein